ncbi:TPA: hypothetical protein SG772_001636 [Campylobacter coli]|nr:hypothetical protein [Campylobacter coli]
MKKILFIKFILILFFNYSYACGGCRDSSLADSKANEGINRYNDGENKIANEIDKISELIKNEIITSEENILKENQILVNLKKAEDLTYKKNNFLLSQSNQIQSIINSLEAK